MKLGIENILTNPVERLPSFPEMQGMRHAAVVCYCNCLITLQIRKTRQTLNRINILSAYYSTDPA